jgi:L-ascorbate oxidase
MHLACHMLSESTPARTYRLRFIGSTTISLVTLGIEGHSDLMIIEADGLSTEAFSTDHIQVASAQRFSVLMHTKSLAELQEDNKTTYWIQYENRDRPANVSRYAILSYNMLGVPPSTAINLPRAPPLALPQQISDWVESSLTPLDPTIDPFPPLSTVTRTVTITVQQLSNGTLQWEENGDVWQTERVYTPYLVKIYQNGQAAVLRYDAALANDGWDPATLAFPAKLGEVLDIVWLNDNGLSGGWDIHPFHAHGGHYWDLGSGNGTYNATANEEKFQAGYVPVKRDTTMLYRYAASGVPHTTAGWRA